MLLQRRTVLLAERPPRCVNEHGYFCGAQRGIYGGTFSMFGASAPITATPSVGSTQSSGKGESDMRSIGRITAGATALATTVGAVIVLAGSPATADAGGYWANQCDYGRACLHLSGRRSGPGGEYWNVNGCGFHQIGDYYDFAIARGNHFIVTYIDNRWDRVEAWTSRELDPANLATNVYVAC
jgi:hypothetical protein